MSNQIVEIRLYGVRLTSGHPMELKESKDPNSGQPKISPKSGQLVRECFTQFAISKNDTQLYGAGGAFDLLQQAARRAWPADPKLDPFSWKIDDGDGFILDKDTGQQKQRPAHCHGHWLLNVKSYNFLPNIVHKDASGQYHEVMDKSSVKTGDYFDVVIRAEHNGLGGTQEGIYLNPALIGFNRPGEAIGGGLGAADASRYFGDSGAQALNVSAPPATPAVPAAPTTPAMPVPPATPAVPAVPTTPAMPVPPATPAVPAVPATAPAVPVPPATPAVPAVPATAPAVPVPGATPATGNIPAPNYDPTYANGPQGAGNA